MGVNSLGSKFFLGGRYARGVGRALVLDKLTFFTGAALTLLVPTLLYCAVSGQLLPLYLMVGDGALGSLLGVFMFARQSATFLSCIPSRPGSTGFVRMKAAA